MNSHIMITIIIIIITTIIRLLPSISTRQIRKARGKNHTLSADFLKNETKDEMRLWNYWERVRERQHRPSPRTKRLQEHLCTSAPGMSRR